ncbi:VapA/VapB family virulence-associated protein [Xenorhabdus hominickii]|uniref:Jacalin-type lectin domain-containing protein n=1 Tax=Xenorhabdus hominickii TaxID=351679 RepID=A0ABM6DVU0_XENHO|nr:VapA/VapB family virulence-associated protein [Xenorhabdus hominickii]AOM42210.1 hypothetical protein A9255_17605 [Xenorhabdus hominickii]
MYFTLTLEVDGAKTFHGKSGGIGSPGVGGFSGNIVLSLDDISLIYQEATTFLAMTTPISVSMAFINSSLDKMAQFDGSGLGTIFATIIGSGYWE